MTYGKYTRAKLIQRLWKYAPHVGCGCYEAKDKCLNTPQCARADYKEMVRELRRREGKRR